ncbi:AAA family ATPase [Gemmatimonas sp.]|uniref:AAA family ATPase n=1 Tax=Gemmatimonas sp. TaxID=1962908 RepID=UPI0025C00916|nr:AAA family ATPase [Gemmatimonas sp.]MCA2992391.1 AAA family ATPase [Gemmatimonas sp.]
MPQHTRPRRQSADYLPRSLNSIMRDPTITEPLALIPGLLMLVSTLLFFAREKVGKTTFIAWLMKQFALGLPVFGRRSKPQTVLYASLEEGVHLVKMRMKEMNVPANAPIHILRTVRHPKLSPLQVLEEAVVRTKATVVIIDSLSAYSVGSKAGNSSDAWNEALYPLTHMAASHGFSLVIVHHANKARGGEEFRGNTAIGAAVDVVASMSIPKNAARNVRRIRFGGRYGAGELFVARNTDGDYDQLEDGSITPEVARGAVTDDLLAARLIEARKAEGGVTMDTLRKSGGVKGTRTDAMVKKLVSDGLLVQKKVRGGCRYFAAA